MRLLSLFVAALLLAPVAKAQLSASDDPLTVSSFYWESEMRRKLPDALCANDSDFIRCHKIGEDQCRSDVKNWMQPCFRALKLSKSVQVTDDGAEAGQKVGICVGEQFQAKYGSTRKKTPDCQVRKATDG